MQPILAESAPHRGRALVFALVLATFAFFTLAPSSPEPSRYRGYHRLPGTGRCPHAKVVHAKTVHSKIVHAHPTYPAYQ
jgi:hypothetical protein